MKQKHLASLATKERGVNILYIPFLFISNHFISNLSWHVKLLMLTQARRNRGKKCRIDTLWHRCFPVNFGKFLRTPFFTEHLRWLLLLQDISGRLLLILKKLNIQTFNSNNSILINIVGTLYLMIRNLDFVLMIDHVFKT